MTEPECAHTGCDVSDLDMIVFRRLVGSRFIEAYCVVHDPIGDPDVSDRFEVVP